MDSKKEKQREYQRNYYLKNKLKLKTKAHEKYLKKKHEGYYIEYYENNKKKILQKAQEHYQYNREKKLHQVQRYYQENQEEKLQQAEQYYQVNREEKLQQAQQYYQVNREEKLQQAQQYYQENREEKLQHAQQYYQNHRENILDQVTLYTVSMYLTDIKEGPTNICISCGRLFFSRQVVLLTHSYILERFDLNTMEFIEKNCLLRNIEQNESIGYVCSNCKLYLLKSKIPPLSLTYTELQFPDIPPEIAQLTRLEERFLAPRIGFIQITSSYVDQQMKSKGRIVNVPTDPEISVHQLPRNYKELGLIMVKLKKRKTDKRSEIVATIRVEAIKQAALILQNSEVYKIENINIRFEDIEQVIIDARNALYDDCEFDSNDIIQNDDDALIEICEVEVNDENMLENYEDSDDENTATDGEVHHEKLADDETCVLTNNDQGIIFAPGENNTPQSILRDTYAESCTFIKIYGGTIRTLPKHLSYQKVMQSEICRYDRRCADPYRIFYIASKLRVFKMASSVQFCMRKTRDANNLKPTANEILNNVFTRNLELKDYAYKVIEHDRGSPAFFQLKKKELFAMIRQLGPPTVFLTLSSAETKWLELIVILKSTVDKEIISENDAKDISYPERCRLLSSDPVTAAKYFDHKLRCMLKLLKQKKECILGNHFVIDYYCRIEFQFRGSPHAHILLWLNEGPMYVAGNQQSKQQCEQFIDKLISCENDANLTPVQYQVHKHSKTCKRKSKKNEKETVCRFQIPWFPMDKTVILEPLKEEQYEKSEFESIKQNCVKIKTELAKMFKQPLNITFDEFLLKLQLNKEQYYIAVRSSISRPTVFLKREVNAIKINAYNRKILELFQANMDIQFIVDVYSCAHYVINYISKSRGQLSKLLSSVVDEVKNDNISIKEKLSRISNVFLNASEFSAQECVYYVLAMPISMCSRDTIHVNTGLPEARIKIIKPKKDLEELSPDSTDIFVQSNLESYIQRPKKLENTCLADFLSLYSKRKTTNKSDDYCESGEFIVNNANDEYDEDDIINNNKDNIDDDNKINDSQSVLHTSTTEYYLRKQARIIKYVKYNRETDEYNYCREQLMLFYPWKNETRDLIDVNTVELYKKHEKVILENRKKYIYKCKEEIIEELYDAEQEIHKNNENEMIDEVPISNDPFERIINEYEVFNDRLDEADIATDLGYKTKSSTKESVTFCNIPYRKDDKTYLKLMKELNKKQRMYVLQLLCCVRSNRRIPKYEIVHGSAGVGKSKLIHAIYQTLLRHYYDELDCNPEEMHVMLCAPTGKASFNIKGMTLHSAYALPVNQYFGVLIPLSSSARNTLFSKLHNLKFLIIDEISMVGSKMLRYIDLRLKQIFGNNLPFGGISVLAFGDFNQLYPVGDAPIYKNVTSNPLSILADNPLWKLFHSFRLTEIMRQKDDKQFAEILCKIADGELSEFDIALLKQRENKILPNNKKIIHLCRTNEEVDSYNESSIANLPYTTVKATDSVLDDALPTETKNYLLSQLQQLPITKTHGLPNTIKLCEDIQYMITNNINTNDGLVNGGIGILKQIDYSTWLPHPIVSNVWLKFEDNFVGKETKEQVKSYCENNNIPPDYVPINFLKHSIKIGKNDLHIVVRRMLPLRIAQALTIHKSQGSTYTEIAIHQPHKLKRRELYVACSRVTSLSGLYFVDGHFEAPKANTNDYGRKEIANLEKNRPVEFDLLFLQDYSINYHTFAYANVQSLPKHFELFKADDCFISAEFLFFVETWSLKEDLFEIDTYQCIYRYDCPNTPRHGYGIMCFAKKHVNPIKIIFQEHKYDNKNESYNIVAFTCYEYCFCVIYNGPHRSKILFKNVLQKLFTTLKNELNSSVKIVVVGDFNIDISNDQAKSFLKYFENQNLHLQVPLNHPSTNKYTQIDLCFANYNDLDCRYYENYFGHHKQITCVLNKPNSTSPISTDSVNFTSIHHESNCTNNSNESFVEENINVEPSNEMNSSNNTNTPISPVINKTILTNQNNIHNSIESRKNIKKLKYINKKVSIIPTINKNILTNQNENNISSSQGQTTFNTKLLPSFENQDAVSCYANSSIQCLFNCNNLMSIINQPTQNFEIDNNVRFSLIMKRLNSVQTINTFKSSIPLRIFAGVPFTNNQQQDPTEFLDKISEKCTIFRDQIQNTFINEMKCTYCDQIIQSYEDTSNFIDINLIPFANNNGDVNMNLLFSTFQQPQPVLDYNCPSCQRHNSCITKTTISQTQNILFIRCNAFQFNPIKNLMEKKTNIKINDIPESRIHVNNIEYKFNSSIFHIGTSLKSGHYIAMIKNENNIFECNDENITLRNWPLNSIYQLEGTEMTPSNMYLLIYEKV